MTTPMERWYHCAGCGGWYVDKAVADEPPPECGPCGGVEMPEVPSPLDQRDAALARAEAAEAQNPRLREALENLHERTAGFAPGSWEDELHATAGAALAAKEGAQ